MEVIHEKHHENDAKEYKMVSLEVLNHAKINSTTPETPASTLRSVFQFFLKSDLHYYKKELRDAEEKLKKAFVEFHEKLRFLKNFAFLNQFAFSENIKKYDKNVLMCTWRLIHLLQMLHN